MCILKEKVLELNDKSSYSGRKFVSHLHSMGKALAPHSIPAIKHCGLRMRGREKIVVNAGRLA
jgi:hypothetical protein